MQQCNAMEICTMFITFFPIFVILILIWFFPFCGKHRLTVSFLKDVITHANSSYLFCRSLRGLPQSVCSAWFSHLKILEWRQWSRLTFSQSIKIWILGLSPFLFLKTLIILHSKKTQGFGTNGMHHWRMAMDCYTLVYDQVKLSWFKIIEWCEGSIDPTETWWHGLIMK